MIGKQHQLKNGTNLDGRYVIDRVLGEGGFGITYDGKNTRIGMRVAIKEFFCRDYMDRDCSRSDTVFLSDDTSRERFENEKARFLKEARILSDFSKEQGIVHVIDYFEINGTAYIVMQFIEGVTLRQQVKQNGRMPAEEIFRKMKPLMKALGKVHESGLIHQDISPDNIMLQPDGTLCLIDFGAAARFDEKSRSYSAVVKNGYAAPEIYRSGNTADPSSDIYALAATAYYCITGTEPEDSLQRILVDELTLPGAMGVDLPDEADKLIRTCLSLKQKERYQDMDSLYKAVDAIWPEALPQPAAVKRKRYVLLGVAIVLVAAALVFGVFTWQKNQTRLRFRDMDTVKIWLSAADDMTIQEYTQSAETVQRRLEVFAGKNNYLWEDHDGEIRMEFPVECLKGNTTSYVLGAYLTRPMTISLLKGNSFKSLQDAREDAFRVSHDKISTVELLTGQIEGVDRQANKLPETGDYRYLKLTLDKETADAFNQKTGDLLKTSGQSLTLAYDLETDFSNHYSEHCLSCGDGVSFYIINWDQDGTFLETLRYDLLHESSKKCFIFDPGLIIDWEQPKTDADAGLYRTTGDYQVREKEIGEDGIYLQYTTSQIKDRNRQRASWLDVVTVFKMRLDALKIPYAFGMISSSYGEASDIIIKVNREDLWAPFAQTLGEALSVRIRPLRKDYSLDDTFTNTEGFELVENNGRYGLQPVGEFAKYNLDKWEQASAGWKEKGIETVYLDMGYMEMPIARVRLEDYGQLKEGQAPVFFDLCLKDKEMLSEDDSILVDYLNTALADSPKYSYDLQQIWSMDEEGKRTGISVLDLPHPISVGQLDGCEKVSGLAEQTGSLIRITNQETGYANIAVQTGAFENDEIPQTMLSLAAEFYEACPWEEAWMNRLDIVLKKEENPFDSYYLIFKYDGKAGSVVLAYAGSGAENSEELNQQVEAAMKKDPFYAAVKTSEDFSFSNANWNVYK